MKNWITPIILLVGLPIYLISFSGESPAHEAKQSFLQASSYFEKGEFKNAESEYFKLIEEGQKSPAVFYNLALTQNALEQPGKAIFHLEKALALSPGSTEIETKLAELRKNSGNAPDDSTSFSQFIPLRWWTLIAGLSVLALVLLPVSRILKFPHGPPVLTTVICLALIAASGYAIHSYDQENKNRAIILTSGTPLRVSPFEGAESLQTLTPGQAVKTIENKSHEDFRLVETGNGNVGWVQSTEVENLTN